RGGGRSQRVGRRQQLPAARPAAEWPGGLFLDGIGGVARIRAAADRADIHLIAADLAFGAVAALRPQAIERAGAAVVEPVVDAAAGLETGLVVAIDADRQVFSRRARRRGQQQSETKHQEAS